MQPESRPICSAVIPVYNAEKSLAELVARLGAALASVTPEYEIILVDDGSKDRSWPALESLSAADGRVKAIRLTRNFGQHLAIMCGFQHAGGEYVVCLDDDLQDLPENAALLLRTISERPDTDAVIAHCPKKHHSAGRDTASLLVHVLQKAVFGDERLLKLSNFFIVRRPIVLEVTKNRSRNILIIESIMSITDKTHVVEVERAKRKYGKTGYSLKKLISMTSNLILMHTDLPLIWVSTLGFWSAFVSFALAAYYLVRYLTSGIGVTGWTTLVLINLFFPGILLLSFGLLGRYLMRIAREVDPAPAFAVRTKRGF